MGLRYRRSINLGGGFRVNISKSGVGYSWGTKGFRVTKKAGGGVRRTYSIPGTGLSWTEDSGSGRKRNRRSNPRNTSYTRTTMANPVQQPQDVLYQAADANVANLVTDNSKQFLAAIKKYLRRKQALKWASIFSALLAIGTPSLVVLFFLFLLGYLTYSNVAKVKVTYDCDEHGISRMQMHNQAVSDLIQSKMVWQVVTQVANHNLKTNGGASSSVNRNAVKFIKKNPHFLKTDATCYYAKLLNDEVYILPDRLLVKGKKGWGVVEYSELNIRVDSQIFHEDGITPTDAVVVGHTWQYVNKNGTPDRRYKNNRQLAKCNYGKITFQTDTGFHVVLYVSNIHNAQNFHNIVSQMIQQ